MSIPKLFTPLRLCGSILFLFPLLGADRPPTVRESLSALRLADPNLTIELVASEPAVTNPVAIAWDAHGRPFVAEMTDYPVGPEGGRIKRLEDRDGDGIYEHATIFAEKLKYPSGLVPWRRGLLVTSAPDLIYFEDADDDGVAETREIILTGFVEGNQQLRVNSPTWGLDNRLYLANGRSGGSVRKPGSPEGAAVPIPRNDLRFDPRTGAIEPISGYSQFGLPRDDWGDRFPSWNTVPLRHVVLEPWQLGSSGGAAVAEILDLADGGRIYSLAPSQKRFNKETVAYFNATCGPWIERGGLLAGYQGHAFVCEPLTSVVHHRRLDPGSVTYRARRPDTEKHQEFLASTHPWFRPVNLADGPDGSLYVVDFCRAWVEHPAFVPEALRNSVDFREGTDKGRIWRIRPKTSKPAAPSPAPGKLEGESLAKRLEHANGWQRDTAQRLLVERQDRAAVPALKALGTSPSPVARVQALWTLEGLKSLDAATLKTAFADVSPRVREHAARLVEARPDAFAAELANLADDADPRVRLRAAIALGKLGDERSRSALATIAAKDVDSSWAMAAVLGSLGDNPSPFLGSLIELPAWRQSPGEAKARVLARLASRVVESRGEPGREEVRRWIEQSQDDQVRIALLSCGANVDAVSHRALAVLSDPQQPAWFRQLALDAAVKVRVPGREQAIAALFDPAQPPALQRSAAKVLSTVELSVAKGLLVDWGRQAIGTRRVALETFTTTQALAKLLLDAIAAGQVHPDEIDPSLREQLVAREPSAEKVLPRREVSSDRRAIIARYEPSLTLKSDPARGEQVFRKNCRVCHARNGDGNRVGPDLASMIGRAPADFLVAIFDPNREVTPDGAAVVVATASGQTYSGLLVEDAPGAIRLRRAEGLEDVIPRAEIEALRPTGRSLMPEGLEQVLPPQDLADLVAYLRSPIGK